MFLTENYTKHLVFGCFAGKDRTGLLAILLTMLLKFSSEDIIHDYTSSAKPLLENINYFENNWKKKGWTKQDYLQRLTPSPKTASLVIEYIQTTFGSIEGYLASLGIQSECYVNMVAFLQSPYRSIE